VDRFANGGTFLMYGIFFQPKKYLFEDVSITGEIFMKILRPGSYRFDYRASNEKNQTIFDLKMYALIA
jgi:hypothetical protein